MNPRLRSAVARSHEDERGIALQTTIVISAMLAIASAVAAVILTRAGEETDQFGRQTFDYGQIENETACGWRDGVWSNPGGDGTCNPPGTAIHNANTSHATYAECHTANQGSPAHRHIWTDNNSDGDGNPATSPSDGSCA